MARHPLPQQASDPMQVGCDDRDADGAFEPRPSMRAHPVQAMAFQRMDRRSHALDAVVAAPRTRPHPLPAPPAGLRATPFRRQGDVLQHRDELPLINGDCRTPGQNRSRATPDTAPGTPPPNGIRINGKGSWSLRMSCNRLIYGNIFGSFGVLQKNTYVSA